RDGTLPWHIPSDLKTFRSVTMGKPLIMGRKTFMSLKKPLDGRDNIVVTATSGYAPEGAIMAHSLPEALAIGKACAERRGVDEIMVIGGGRIFAEALPLADRIYLTEISGNPPGDVTFPRLDPEHWRTITSAPIPRSEKDEFDCIFKILEKLS